MSAGKVDVLTVMGLAEASVHVHEGKEAGKQMKQARVAVANLIEASGRFKLTKVNGQWIADPDSVARFSLALAKVLP